MTSAYTFVAPERQNELTRRIQQRIADASQEQKKDPATTAVAPSTPSAPEAPPSLGDVALATLLVQ
jgi:hypothetical protein